MRRGGEEKQQHCPSVFCPDIMNECFLFSAEHISEIEKRTTERKRETREGGMSKTNYYETIIYSDAQI